MIPSVACLVPPRHDHAKLGHHAMFERSVDRDNKTMKLANSWGDGWGDRGHVSVDDKWLRDPIHDVRFLGLRPLQGTVRVRVFTVEGLVYFSSTTLFPT